MKTMNRKLEEEIKRKIALLSLASLLLGVLAPGIFVPAENVSRADDNSGICSASVDVVLVMDKSGSMSEGEAQSKCEWWNQEIVGPSYQWVYKTDYNVTEEWCDSKNEDKSSYRWSVFTPAANSKITDAKSAANIFLENLGADDQSALVSFADEANLDKSLSNNHSATQTAVNNLITGGATNIGEAIALGTEELGSAEANPQAVKAMILLTDGKANMPNGNGSDENQADIDLAINNANVAADLGYKIFTIGLGNNSGINETMLQQIASDTGANYYQTPTSAELESIYNQISAKICEYGSVSGCKYNDSNNDGNIAGENTISNWEITLSDGANDPIVQQTDLDGCYNFAGLSAGEYTVSEVQQDGWIQTYPLNSSYSFSLAEGENVTGKDFGNYFPTIIAPQCSDQIDNDEDGFTDYPDDPGCDSAEDDDEYNCADADQDGICDSIDNCAETYNPDQADTDIDGVGDVCDNCSSVANSNQLDANSNGIGDACETSSISGCKYKDVENIGAIDEGEEKLSGWEIQLIRCPYPPLPPDSPMQFLSKGILDSLGNGEPGNCVLEAMSITNDDGCYIFSGLDAGDYGVSEITQVNWEQTFPVDNTFYYFNLAAGETKNNIDFLNQEMTTPSECSAGETSSFYSGPAETEGVGVCEAGIRTCVEGNWGEYVGEVLPQAEVCGNGIDEDCNGSDASCGGGGGGGGGGIIFKPSITITNEKVSYLGSGEALVTWETNIETTQQVAYGDNSVSPLGVAPKYGYDLTNQESDDMMKSHSAIISGLIDGIQYYFRPIADRNGSTGEVVGKEVSYELEKKGEVKGVTDTPAPEIAPCNYLLEYIKLGADNNPIEVKKLETFLNIFEGEKLAVNGIYEQVDFDAVSRFQKKYSEKVLSPWSYDEPTGYVYITTKKRINELYCKREFPLTPEQEAEIAKFSAIAGTLTEESATSPAGSGTSGSPSENPVEMPDENANGEDEGRVKSAETQETAGENADENKNKNDSEINEGKNTVDETKSQKESEKNEQAESSSNNYLIFFFVILLIALAYYIFGYKKKQD